MNEEQIKKIIEDVYDESKDNTYRSMVRDFYSRKMLSTAILTWLYFLIIVAVAIYSGKNFFNSTEIKDLIQYAALFICSMIWLNLIKIWAWQMVHRNGIKREIKRLELRIAELNETVKTKTST